MDTQINSLVYDYLSAVSPKIAKKFKKVVKPEELPTGSPKLKDIFSAVNSSTSKRKRGNGVVDNGTTAAKKAKKDYSSVKNANPAPVENLKANGKKQESSSEESSDEDETPVAKTAAKVPAAKKKESSGDSRSNEEKEEKSVAPFVKKAAANESSSDESDSDEEKKLAAESPAPKALKEPGVDRLFCSKCGSIDRHTIAECTMSTAKCFNCMKEGHRKNDCPQPHVDRCLNCREIGHKLFECTKHNYKRRGGAPIGRGGFRCGNLARQERVI